MRLDPLIANALAEQVRFRLEGGRIDVADQVGNVIVTLKLGPFSRPEQGAVRAIEAPAGYAAASGQPAQYQALDAAGAPVLAGLAGELGLTSYIAERASVALEQFVFRVPL